MAVKRKRAQVSTNQENAPERQLRSGKTLEPPKKSAKQPKASGSRSPRKRALQEAKEATQLERDDDAESEKPSKARKLSPDATTTGRRNVNGITYVDEAEVIKLLGESPQKRGRKRRIASDAEVPSLVSEPSSVRAVGEDEVIDDPKTPSRRASKRTKAPIEVVIRTTSKSGTPVRHISAERTSETFPRARSEVLRMPESTHTPHIPRISACLDAQKRAILQALQQPYPPTASTEPSAVPTTEDVARKQLNDLVQGTVARREGNSCLLLGPRGSGKSMILQQTLSELATKPVILRLSGFVQTSDKLALREIALQLLQQTGSSFLVEEEEPPSGQPGVDNDDDENPFLVQTNGPKDDQPMRLPPSSQLHALIPVLLTLGKPVVVILDAFDLFAMHPRQSLLYCLLDTAQSCHATPENRGIAVIGVTTRIDTIQLLEKRVKSRFSGRTIRTAPPSSLDDWLVLARNILQVSAPDEGEDHSLKRWQQQWNSGVEEFLDHGEVINVFNDTFSITKDVKVLQRLLTRTIMRLDTNEPYLRPKHLVSSVDSQRTRPIALHLNGLSYPTICLLVASVHTYAAGHNSFTFEMLFENFRDQLRSSTSAPVQVNGGHIGMVKCTREVLLTAYDGLRSAKVFVPAAAPSSSLAEGYIRHRSTLDRNVVTKVVEKSGQVHLKKWLIKGG